MNAGQRARHREAWRLAFAAVKTALPLAFEMFRRTSMATWSPSPAIRQGFGKVWGHWDHAAQSIAHRGVRGVRTGTHDRDVQTSMSLASGAMQQVFLDRVYGEPYNGLRRVKRIVERSTYYRWLLMRSAIYRAWHSVSYGTASTDRMAFAKNSMLACLLILRQGAVGENHLEDDRWLRMSLLPHGCYRIDALLESISAEVARARGEGHDMIKDWSPSTWQDFIDGMLSGDLYMGSKTEFHVIMPSDLFTEDGNGSQALYV